MNEQLEYAEMLEIPVNTVNVVKKKSIFKRRQKKSEPEIIQDDLQLKEQVVESVNERVGATALSEDVSDPPKPEKKKKTKNVLGKVKDKGNIILISEAIAIGAIAIAIFLTNLFMPNTVINTFLGSFSTTNEKEPTYSEFTLAPVVSAFSDAEVFVSENGVLSFTAEGSVYPICAGKISSVSEENGLYTVKVAHTSTFTSVVTGLTKVYSALGTAVRPNIPLGYSDGNAEVQVSMYDNGELLNCYSISDEIPVWNS